MPYAYYILHTKTISLSMETSTWMHNSAVRFKEWYYTNYAGNILTRCYIIQYIIHITCIIKYNYALSITSKNIISIIIQSCTALGHSGTVGDKTRSKIIAQSTAESGFTLTRLGNISKFGLMRTQLIESMLCRAERGTLCSCVSLVIEHWKVPYKLVVATISITLQKMQIRLCHVATGTVVAATLLFKGRVHTYSVQ